MDNQSKKIKRDDDDDGGSAITVDTLSQLPQFVLHHILSFLSQKDAVRTCVLSKSWCYLWQGRLNVEFRDKWFTKKNKFWSFFDKTLQRYHDQNLSLHQFIVDIRGVVDLVLLQKWIPVIIMNMGVRSFILSCGSIVFPLPLLVFQSEFLVELDLEFCDLNTFKSTDNVMLNNLRTLRLHYIHIKDEILEKIILGCPLIENLDVERCIGLKSIKLHKHHNIKDFGCSVSDPLIIELEDPHTLESFRIENYCLDWFLPHKHMHFPHLKSLNLHRVQWPAEAFVNFSSFFPCLDDFTLDICDGLKEFLLLSPTIKRLTINMDLKNRIKAFIDTPNILYFEYSGHGFLPSIKFASTSNEWNSKITVCYKLRRSYNDATSWFLKLNKLLKALSQSHITLNLIRNKYKKLDIDDSYGGFYKPVVVKHFKLLGYISPSSDPAILNCFFRICRPSYIHVDEYGNDLAEFICNLIPKETDCYFWLQDLEEVCIEVWDMMADEWHCVEGTSLPALPNKQRIRFRLTWRES